MTRNHERELETLLTGGPVPVPPADLAAKIAAEIPDTVELHPSLQSDHDATVVPLRRRRTPWLAAAAAVLTLSLTAAVTWQLRSSGPATAERDKQIPPATANEQQTTPLEESVAKVDDNRQAPEAATVGGRSETESDRTPGDDRQPIMRRMTTTSGAAPEAKDEAAAAPAPQPQLRSLMRSAPRPEPTSNPGSQSQEVRRDKATANEAPGLAARQAQPLSELSHDPDEVTPSEPRAAAKEITVTAEVGLVDTTPVNAGQVYDKEYLEKAQVVSKARGQSQYSVATGSENAYQIPDAAVVFEVQAPPPPTVPPSTGGTTEPNDQPYGDMFFRGAGVNPFVDTEDDALSTFGLEVDTGSFNVVKRYLADGNLPPAEAVRVEELVNAFDYGDRPPRRGDFALTAEGGPTPYATNDRYRLVRFAIKAREVDASRRPPATLVFVIDVSGSMDRENRLGLVKRALSELLAELRPDDRVGLVVYGSRGQVLLDPTSDLERVRRAIDRLQAGGSTNAEEGLVLGYELAADNLQRGRISRVVLCSDGVANVGRTGPESILARIRSDVARGIELTAVGFGMGNYNDALMERLADTGDGRYAYVDTLAEARRIFVEELTGTLYTVAREAKAQVEFDPDAVSRWRLLGYENRDIADERFRDPTVDAGEIGAGHTVTALYEVKLADGARRRDTLATLRVRYRPAESERPVELEQRLAVGDLSRSFADATPAFRLAAAVAELAELLKGAYWARGGSLDAVLDTLHDLDRDFYRDPRFDDLLAMTREARSLLAQRQRDTAPDDDGDR